MRSNTEFRELAWKRLWADHWFGRLFGGGLLLSLCGSAVNVAIGGILGRLGVLSWQDYVQAVMQNRQDLTTPIPNLTHDFMFQATSATILQMFMGYIMAGIAAYGAAVILLRCLKNEENGWLGSAFGGFRDPFGMLWLYVRLVLIYLGWGILLIIPPLGIWLLLVAFYRYRFVFLVKAEHPDWSAGECLRSCKALMRGRKMASFRLDCSYWKPIALISLFLIAFVVSASMTAFGPMNAMMGFVSVATFLVTAASFTVLFQYISVGQAFFYEEVKNSVAAD